MDPNTFPTKGNLILAKNSLKLSRQGYELMGKKRNILIREMMELIDQAKDIQTQIDVTFRAAYTALQKANMEIGIAFVQQIACTVPVENSIRIKTRSVMGTEIPLVEYDKTTNTPTYAYYSTKMSLDEAKAAFEKVKGKLFKGKGADRPPVHGGKCSHPPCSQYQENSETCQCSEEYHYSEVRGTDQRYPECTGGERT